jgi:hypothetical protein
MKKFLLIAVFSVMFMQSSAQAAGGIVPCIAPFLFEDVRIGLYINDGKEIETMDWIVLGMDILTGLGPFVSAYDAYSKSNSMKGCCVGYFWGRRAGGEINTYKLRSKEILMCIPVVNIYPCIAIPCEGFSGKTMTQVIADENLKR